MRNLNITVVNNVATYRRRDGAIVCGNSDYQITFTFDAEWEGYEAKKARFIWNGAYKEVAFTGTVCPVPVINNATEVRVGVYVENEGTLETTTAAVIPCRRCILCETDQAQSDLVGGWRDEAVEAAERAEDAATRAEQAAGGTTDEVARRLAVLEAAVSDLNYEAIEITSFAVSPNTAEMGSSVAYVSAMWAFNKTPASIKFAGTNYQPTATLSSVTGPFTTNQTWRLEATDERDAIAEKSASLTFLNGVYYGVAAQPTTVNSAFVLNLSKTLRSNKLPSFTANATTGKYIWYCLPKRMGTCSFKVGGFEGGFTLHSTIAFTNASGYTEDYYIYRSDNVSLGSTTISVS